MCYTFSSKLGPEVHGSAEMFQIDIRAFSAVFFFFFFFFFFFKCKISLPIYST
jgi:hypothetical protein